MTFALISIVGENEKQAWGVWNWQTALHWRFIWKPRKSRSS